MNYDFSLKKTVKHERIGSPFFSRRLRILRSPFNRRIQRANILNNLLMGQALGHLISAIVVSPLKRHFFHGARASPKKN